MKSITVQLPHSANSEGGETKMVAIFNKLWTIAMRLDSLEDEVPDSLFDEIHDIGDDIKEVLADLAEVIGGEDN